MLVDTVDLLMLNNFEIKLLKFSDALSINYQQYYISLFLINHHFIDVIKTC